MKQYIKTVLGSLLIGITLASCDSFLDVNENPNDPINENLTLSSKLPAALWVTAYQENIQLNQLGSFWSGYWGTTSEGSNTYKKEAIYNGPAIMAKRDGIPVWENAFVYLEQYNLIKKQAVNENAPFYQGVAQIMQAWHFMRLVDVYGDVPFDEALQGQAIPTPAYEDGKIVYEKAFKLINEAISLIKEAPAGSKRPSTDDILFKGDIAKWVQFANTLKLRALLRQSETDNMAFVQTELQKIINEGTGFLSTSALVQPGFTTSKPNPFWNTYYRNTSGVETNAYIDIRPTQHIIDVYASLNDPRLALLYAKTTDNKYKGVLFGNPEMDDEYNRTNTSPFKGPKENGGDKAALFKSAEQPFVLLGNFESYFLQAEAAQRGWIQGNAADLYARGIEASLLYMEVGRDDRSDYLAQKEVQYNGTLEQIIQQKWLSLNSISGMEAWCDYRRLGLPAIPNSLGAENPNDRPRRLMYPETEVQTNINEVNKRQVTDITKARVWWDVN